MGGARAAPGRGRCERFGELVAAAARADRRRPRQRRLPPPRARRPRPAHADVGLGGAAVRLTPDRQRRAARGRRRLGGREPAHRRCATTSTCRAPRTPASRASAARARSTSTARSCARASCSPARPRAARWSPSRGSRRRRGAARRPAGLRRGRRGAVRLLHAGPDRRQPRPAGAQRVPHRPRDPRGAGRQPVPLHGLREDPRRGAAGGREARDEDRHRGLRDRHGRRGRDRARDGHLVIEGDRIVAVGEGPAPATRRGARASTARGCLATPGPRQLPPPPLPVGHARPRPAGDALRVARRALSGLGARRRRGRVGGRPRRAGRARALGLLDLDRPPLRLPGRRRRPARGRDRGGARRSACASTRAAGRWTSGAPTAGCRPTRSSRTATRSSPPARRPSTASTTRRPGRWCASRWRRARRSRSRPSSWPTTAQLARRRGVRLHTHLAETLDEEVFCRRALRRAPGAVPRGPRLAGRRRVARALRPPERRGGRALRRDRAPAWRTARAPTRAWAPASRRSSTSRARARPSASASTAPRPTRRARWRSSCARRCSSRAWRGGPAALTARDALALATIEGARCLGRDDELGSLEPGKLADVALWRLDGLDHAGIEDPVAALVLGAPRPVDLLLVGGRAVVEGAELRTADVDEIAARHRAPEPRGCSTECEAAA